MDRQSLQDLLQSVASGDRSVSQAMDALRDFPVAELEHATLDTHRALRRGFPEVVLADGKTHEQLVSIVANLLKRDGDILVTRISAEDAQAVAAACPHPSAEIDDQAHAAISLDMIDAPHLTT